MLTVFAVPKPFQGEFAVIQRNAIGSWTRLEPAPEVILFGQEPGTAALCDELGLGHVGEVAANEAGTPFLNDVFARAQASSRHELLCYVNADIILLGDFMAALARLGNATAPFLGVGQRWELEVRELLDFSRPAWEAELQARRRSGGELAGFTAIDYFLFHRGFYAEMPPFFVGRPAFDWWLIHSALSRSARVIDLTPSVTAIHQRHAGGPLRERIWFEAEIRHNLALYRVAWTNLYDATHVLTPGGLRPLRWRKLRKAWWRVQWRYLNTMRQAAASLRRRLRGQWAAPAER
ncbi:MAG: hypothetical protein HY703_05370 [Gemmatimonadetes bacterium]|nr:hypothetical protein [Gemmatimonadota bacterium]